MRNGQVSLRERDGSQADLPLAEAVSCLQARARLSTLAAGAL
jgi:threonyl-tRNA synthetase